VAMRVRDGRLDIVTSNGSPVVGKSISPKFGHAALDFTPDVLSLLFPL
jgi:hypothetical protein